MASGDEVVALGIDVAKVAGIEPAVFEDFRGGLRAIVVALHDGGTGKRNLPDEVPIFIQLGVHHLGLQPRQRRADGADDVGIRRGAEATAGGLRHAESLQHLEAESLNIAADLSDSAKTANPQDYSSSWAGTEEPCRCG